MWIRAATRAPLRAGSIDLSGIVEQALGAKHDDRLEDVEVCQDGVPNNCVRTDAHGWFALGGIMPETEILLVYRKEGFWPSLLPVVAPRWSSEFAVFGLFPHDDLVALAERQNAVLRAAGRPEVDLSDGAQAGRASILFGANSGYAGTALSGQVRVELDPPSGAGPLYFLDNILNNGDIALDPPTGGSHGQRQLHEPRAAR